PSGVQHRVLAVGFDPIDLTRLEKRNLPARPDHQPVDRPLIEQRQQPTLGRTSQRLSKPLRLDRLEEIVDRVDVEGLDGVLVVRGDEDDGRQPIGRDGVEHLEAVEVGHLHVEEYKVGAVLEDRFDRFAASAALTNDRHARHVTEQRANAFPGKGFIVDDEGAHRLHVVPPLRCAERGSGGEVLRGIVSRTVNPPSPISSNPPRPPYNRLSRSRVFARPIPLPGVVAWSPGPSSDTSSWSAVPLRRPDTATWPTSGRSAMPCRMAFSTIGCSTRLGTIAFRTSVLTST